MTTSESKNHERVVDVMVSVLNLAPAAVTDRIAQGHTPNWDSLKHMALILALEEEFDVSFTDEEVVEMISLPLIVAAIDARVSTSKRAGS